MIAAHWWAALCLLSMGVMLIGEFKAHRPTIAVSKVIASSAFVILAISLSALDTFYGKAILTALILSWWGDVFLIPQSEKIFKLGILAFLLGHLGFGAAFVTLGFNPSAGVISVLVIGLFSAGILRWLYPHLDAAMKGPVIAYIFVISVMVVCAIASSWASNRYLILLGATMFFLSDLAVAKNRFVSPGFSNKLWGLPLYYGAQVILAYTIQTT